VAKRLNGAYVDVLDPVTANKKGFRDPPTGRGQMGGGSFGPYRPVVVLHWTPTSAVSATVDLFSPFQKRWTQEYCWPQPATFLRIQIC